MLLDEAENGSNEVIDFEEIENILEQIDEPMH